MRRKKNPVDRPGCTRWKDQLAVIPTRKAHLNRCHTRRITKFNTGDWKKGRFFKLRIYIRLFFSFFFAVRFHWFFCVSECAVFGAIWGRSVWKRIQKIKRYNFRAQEAEILSNTSPLEKRKMPKTNFSTFVLSDKPTRLSAKTTKFRDKFCHFLNFFFPFLNFLIQLCRHWFRVAI